MIRIIFVAIISLVFVSCSDFPTRFDRIEPEALRSIGFVYKPFAEGAPGDTLTVRAYFGGEKTTSIAWSYSINHIKDNYGTDTVLDVTGLPIVHETINLPDSVDVSFVIPDSTFFITKSIDSKTFADMREMLPSGMHTMTQADFAAFAQSLGSINLSDLTTIAPFIARWGTAMGISTLDSSAFATITGICSVIIPRLSIDAVIYAKVTSETGKSLKIKGNFTIRYNNKFKNTPIAFLLPTNKNPTLHWIGVYKVHLPSLMSFDPADEKYSGKYSFTYLYHDRFPDSVHDTIDIDVGYSYFFAADTGINTFTDTGSGSAIHDTTIDYYRFPDPNEQGNDTTLFETWYYRWQYQNCDLDSVTDPLDSLFILTEGTSTPLVKVYPSIDTKLRHARIWTTTSDMFLGEINRPSGFSTQVLDIYFTYSEAYRKAHP